MRTSAKEQERAVTRAALARIWLVARALRERRDHSKVNAASLAQDLEVCTKTIHRDLEFLRDRLRHDIQYDAAKGTWFYRSIPLLTYL